MSNAEQPQIWNKNQLDRELARVVLVIGVVGFFGAIRADKIFSGLSTSFQIYDWFNVLDLLVGSWVAYLILMVFGISDDILTEVSPTRGRAVAIAARSAAHLIFVFGAMLTVYAALYVAYLHSPTQTMGAVVLLIILFVIGKMQRKKTPRATKEN